MIRFEIIFIICRQNFFIFPKTIIEKFTKLNFSLLDPLYITTHFFLIFLCKLINKYLDQLHALKHHLNELHQKNYYIFFY